MHYTMEIGHNMRNVPFFFVYNFSFFNGILITFWIEIKSEIVLKMLKTFNESAIYVPIFFLFFFN